jgi:hypothetical protein
MIASTIVVVPPCHVLLIRAAHLSRVKSSTAAREHRGTPDAAAGFEAPANVCG